MAGNMNDAGDSLTDLERGVLLAMAEEDPERETLLRQIDTASVVSRDYTGVSLYSKLAVAADVPRLRTPNRSIEDDPKLSLVHPELEVGAGVILWLDDARIDTIEFYTFAGDWPKDEAAFRIAEDNKPRQAPADLLRR